MVDVSHFRHPEPLPRGITQLKEFTEQENFGTIDSTSSKSFAASLEDVRAEARKRAPFFEDVVNFFAVKPMQLAQYFCSGSLPRADWHHYALNFDEYTHFTSPIRRYSFQLRSRHLARYPDLVVHRLLQASISLAEAKEVCIISPKE